MNTVWSKVKSGASKTREFVFGSKESEGASAWWIVFAILLYISDILLAFNGFEFGSFISNFSSFNIKLILSTFVGPGVLSIFFAYFVFKRPGYREAFSFFVFVVIMWLIVTMSGVSLGKVIHLIFTICIYVFVIYPNTEDKAQANYICAGLLLADFFLFTAFAEFFSMPYFTRLIIPFWFFLTLVYTRRSRAKTVLVFLVIMIYVYNSSFVILESGYPDTREALLSKVDIDYAKHYIKTSWENFIKFWTDVGKSAVKSSKRLMNDTLGEYYTGEIDRNAQLKLGVYLEELKAADTVFYEDQPVTIWSNLVAQTLGETIYVIIDCKKMEDGKRTDVDNVKVYPKDVFEVDEHEEVGLECSYDVGVLKEDSHDVSMGASFNFLTQSYIKTYFMDLETTRALRREGVDPLEHYGIVDKNPTAIYTSGPVEIGLDVGKPPLDSGRDFRLGITIKPSWEGEVTKINRFYIVTPKGIEFATEGNEYFCRGRKEYVFKDSSCSKIDEEEKGCDDILHNVFELDMEHENNEYIKNIDDHETIACWLKPDKTGLFEDSQIATKYFKVVVDYIYTLHKELGVTIKGGDGVRTVLEEGDCSKKCDDKDGCLCPNGCEKAKGIHIGNKADCGGVKKEEETTTTSPGGCVGEWQSQCPCEDGQDGVYCFVYEKTGKKEWRCTTKTDEAKLDYHSKDGCPKT